MITTNKPLKEAERILSEFQLKTGIRLINEGEVIDPMLIIRQAGMQAIFNDNMGTSDVASAIIHVNETGDEDEAMQSYIEENDIENSFVVLDANGCTLDKDTVTTLTSLCLAYYIYNKYINNYEPLVLNAEFKEKTDKNGNVKTDFLTYGDPDDKTPKADIDKISQLIPLMSRAILLPKNHIMQAVDEIYENRENVTCAMLADTLYNHTYGQEIPYMAITNRLSDLGII